MGQSSWGAQPCAPTLRLVKLDTPVVGGYKSPQGIERGISYAHALKVMHEALADG